MPTYVRTGKPGRPRRVWTPEEAAAEMERRREHARAHYHNLKTLEAQLKAKREDAPASAPAGE